MTIHQGDMIDDTSFCVLICDKDDIKYVLMNNGLSDKEAEVRALQLTESDGFRKKFVDAMMTDFSDTIGNIIEDMEY